MAPAAASSSTMPQSPAPSSFPIGNGLTISSTRKSANAKTSDQGAIPCGPPGGDPHAAGFVQHEPARDLRRGCAAPKRTRARPDRAGESEHGEDRERPADSARGIGMTSNGMTSSAAARAAAVPGRLRDEAGAEEGREQRAAPSSSPSRSAFGFPDQQDALAHVEDAGGTVAASTSQSSATLTWRRTPKRVLERELRGGGG